MENVDNTTTTTFSGNYIDEIIHEDYRNDDDNILEEENGTDRSENDTTTATHTTTTRTSLPLPPSPSTTNNTNASNTSNTSNNNTNMIHMIQNETIQRIVASQAIYDLTSCIKELIDNAIDANSTTINIRLYNKGIDIIEVSDDGIGIPKESHPYIALPHATSKISTYHDIYNNNNNNNNTNNTTASSSTNETQQQQQQSLVSSSSLGFRGEALYCIANISEQLMIATRTQNDDMATKMIFHQNGTLDTTNITYITRKVGTTVAIMKLFHPLSVRRKDYILHIIEQRQKLIQCLIHYSIFLSYRIRFHIIDMIPNKKNNTIYKEKSVFITPYYDNTTTTNNNNNNITLKDSVSSILGSHILNQVSDITIDLYNYIHSKDTTTTDTSDSSSWKITGLISSMKSSNANISSSSNQTQQQKNASSSTTTTNNNNKPVHYFAINQRPVDIPKLSRFINKLYRTCYTMNRNNNNNTYSNSTTTTTVQYCICIFEFYIPIQYYDINISPDKKQVQFYNEQLLYTMIEQALIEFWTMDSNNTTQQYDNNNTNSTSIMTIPTLLSQQQQKQSQSQPSLRNTSMSSTSSSRQRKSSLVTTSSNSNNHDSINTFNDSCCSSDNSSCCSDHDDHDHDDTNSISAFANIKNKNYNDTSNSYLKYDKMDDNDNNNNNKNDQKINSLSLNDISSSHSTNQHRTYHRRYAFVHDPQQSIQKEQEYNFDNTTTYNVDDSSNSNNDVSLPTEQTNPSITTTTDMNIDSNDNNIEYANKRDISVRLDMIDCVADPTTTLLQSVTPSPATLAVSSHIQLERNDITIKDDIAETNNYDTTNDQYMNQESTKRKHDEYQQFQQIQEKFNKRHRRSDSINTIDRLVTNTYTTTTNDNHNNHATAMKKTIQTSSLNKFDRFGYQEISSTKNRINVTKPYIPTTRIATTTVATNPSIQKQNIDTSKLSLVQHQSIRTDNDDDEDDIHQSKRKQQRLIRKDHEKEFEPTTEQKNNNDLLQQQNPDKAKRKEFPVAKTTTTPESAESILPPPASSSTTTSTPLWQSSIQSSNDIVMASIQDRVSILRRKKKQRQQGQQEATTSGSIDRTDDNNNDNNSSGIIPSSLSKDDLRNLKVIGQFNLGFIIAIHNNNVYILDQHACDERYHFETLCRETTLFQQPLIAPLPLELSYMEETCILDHQDIFEKNGFRFQYDATKPSRHRFSLLSVPHSGAPDGRNAVQYGKQDVQDLCAILLDRNHHYDNDNTDDYMNNGLQFISQGGTGTDGSGQYGNNAVRRYVGDDTFSLSTSPTTNADQIIARLPKTIAMMASRACRNSIMIGKALSKNEMEKLIQRLSSNEIKSPWICAHGRPTICHVGMDHQHAPGESSSPSLLNLSSMIQQDERRTAQHIATPTITCFSQEMIEQDDEES